MSNNGYLYVVYSHNNKKNLYFNQFINSLNSLKHHVPNCKVTLYTNIQFDNIYGINVIYDENIPKNVISKAHGILKMPYDKIIYLDTDTIIHRNIINDIFDVLDEFEFTCCYGNQNSSGTIYPDLNTGLLGIRNNAFTKECVKIWISEYEAYSDKVIAKRKGKRARNSKKVKPHNDQLPFRDHIFMKNKSKFHILPTYFMFRWCHYRSYTEQAVLTHSHNMSKEKETDRIIASWNDFRNVDQNS